jgi:hypothetical protein
MPTLRALRFAHRAATARPSVTRRGPGGGGLGPAVTLGDACTALPRHTTALLGAAAHAADQAEVQGWLRAVASWLGGGAPPSTLGAPVRDGELHVWALLAEGSPGFDPSALSDAVPEGTAWFAALEPERFFAQAAERLGAAGGERAERLAGRLRQPSGELALVSRMVTTVALSLDLAASPSAALVLRVGCSDLAASVQASVLLHAWRARRALGTDAAATAFAGAEVRRGGTRVEVAFQGTADAMGRLFVPPRTA